MLKVQLVGTAAGMPRRPICKRGLSISSHPLAICLLTYQLLRMLVTYADVSMCYCVCWRMLTYADVCRYDGCDVSGYQLLPARWDDYRRCAPPRHAFCRQYMYLCTSTPSEVSTCNRCERPRDAFCRVLVRRRGPLGWWDLSLSLSLSLSLARSLARSLALSLFLCTYVYMYMYMYNITFMALQMRASARMYVCVCVHIIYVCIYIILMALYIHTGCAIGFVTEY